MRDARADPWCASCLLRERIGEAPDSFTIRTLVALGEELAELTGERPASVHERVVDLALAGALSNKSSPVDSAYAAASMHPQLRDNGLDPQEQAEPLDYGRQEPGDDPRAVGIGVTGEVETVATHPLRVSCHLCIPVEGTGSPSG
ncbi:MAG: hypothetical protein R2789_17545 [Microthrixaceae bacterium]